MEDPNKERICLCALNRIFGYEPRMALGLLEHFGSAAEIFQQKQRDIAEALGSCTVSRFAESITESAFESAAMELEEIGRNGCRFIGIGEPGYPKLLAECRDAPVGLYFRGCSPPEQVLSKAPAVAVVGTRALSLYGKDWCGRIVSSLSKSRSRPLIVSGMALGADTSAHNAALDGGLPTVAVMATGINEIYPAQNRKLGERIAGTEGCALISDYPPGTKAVRVNFIRRNRIIAGICQATILVESRIKGGGMMTARLAASYERELFALPGRVDDPASQGCNLLIRQKLAEPIGDLVDLAAQLGLERPVRSSKDDFLGEIGEMYRGTFAEAEVEDILRLARVVKDNRGISIDELSARLRWSFSKTSRVTALLECDGFMVVDLLQHCSARFTKNAYL